MSFARLLQPRHIAIIGGREAEEVIQQCIKAGYQGKLWPVHPKKQQIAGLDVYASLQDLPAAPDAAYVAVNRNLTINMVKELAAMGAGGAICYATGFSESGPEGEALEAELLAASAEMPLLGPNCYGLINYVEQAIIWPDQHGGEKVETGVAIITQSSNVAVNLSMQQRGLPISYLVSLGNKVKFDLHDAIREFAKRDSVSAIGLYVEGISDPSAFESAVRYARELGKPVVAIKSGRSAVAQKITLSHTASLAGSDELISALFARNGVGRVNSLDALIEALKVLHIHGPLQGYKLGSMSPSGGDGALVADAVEDTRFELSALTEHHQQTVKNTVHDLVTVSNPLDYQLFDWLDTERLTATYAAFIEREFDISLCVFDYPRPDRCDDGNWQPAQQAIINAVASTDAKVAVLATMPECLPEHTAKTLMAHSIVPLSGLIAGVEGLQAAADIGVAWQSPLPAALFTPPKNAEDKTLTLIDEAQAKQRLAEHGVVVPNSVIVATPNEVASAVTSLKFPLVVKALGVAHKTELGAVKLNLRTLEDVSEAVAGMAELSSRFLIEEMISDVVAEIIVGVVKDEQFGPYLVLGAGGILVELMRDSRSLLLPVSRAEVNQALKSLRSAILFHGFRGRAEADLDAAVDAILAIADFAQQHGDTIEELDINPLMLRATGQGAIAADALLRIRV
ncbi:Acyl-CoA synthetase (NDP forming) [Colwellia chukchiensis]|uniref:Acyl-CoA synthetase (NDP forming) n=1 Tax=Colwellia chukchiensis TaxID=641665 RepID=A0A1H7I1M2_9GAMM|nr:acetate--CoA ligase family protein [Colwellia chukchiensis]SEK55320.1 Acyl-CoA synthetase (NDP forming) [Colwellia chukchiensis]